jgi:hypothetical protein
LVASATPVPTPAKVREKIVSPSLVASATPAPTPAKKITQQPPPTPPLARVPILTPAPLVVQHQAEPAGNTAASEAMKGSMLMAGLPEGPSRLKARSAPLATAPVESAFSLRGIARELSLTTQPVAKVAAQPASTDSVATEKRDVKVAFRGSLADPKAKP